MSLSGYFERTHKYQFSYRLHSRMAPRTIDRHTLSIGRVISFTSHKFEKSSIRKVLRTGTSSERIILPGILQCKLKILKSNFTIHIAFDIHNL
jgi:hypothetical protein